MSATIVTIKITHEEKERLRAIAKKHGLVIGRGNEADWGSIRQLNEAIANNRLLVVENPTSHKNGQTE